MVWGWAGFFLELISVDCSRPSVLHGCTTASYVVFPISQCLVFRIVLCCLYFLLCVFLFPHYGSKCFMVQQNSYTWATITLSVYPQFWFKKASAMPRLNPLKSMESFTQILLAIIETKSTTEPKIQRKSLTIKQNYRRFSKLKQNLKWNDK